MYKSATDTEEIYNPDVRAGERSSGNLEPQPTGDGRLVSLKLREGAALFDLENSSQTQSVVMNIQDEGGEKIYTVGMVEPTNQPHLQKIADALDVSWRKLVIAKLEPEDFRELFVVAYNSVFETDEEKRNVKVQTWEDLIDFHKETNTDKETVLEDSHALGDKQPENAREMGEQIIRTAIEQKASDIHFDMGPQDGMVRMRIDGRLYSKIRTKNREVDFSKLPNDLVLKMCGAFGAKAGIDFNDLLNKPQDGSFVLPYRDQKAAKKTRIRFGCLPRKIEAGDQRGVKVTLRINQEMITDLNALGAEPEVLDTVRKGLMFNGGIGLFLGPTGSGKTNWISACHTVLRKDLMYNVMEYSDTIEQMFDGICQTETGENCSDEEVIKSWLRNDPDKLIAAEIRDKKAAESLIDIAVAGKLVLTTAHTSSLSEAFIRLERLGIDRYIQSETLRFIVFTTLARRLCVHCRVQGYNLRGGGQEDFEYVSSEKGCEYCSYRCYRGRTSIAEAILISPEVSEWIRDGLPGTEICRRAEEKGFMFPLREAIRRKVYVDKITSRAEILRVVDVERRIVQSRKPSKEGDDGWRDQPSKKEADYVSESENEQRQTAVRSAPPVSEGGSVENIIEMEEVGENDFAIELDENWNLSDEEINQGINAPVHSGKYEENILNVFEGGDHRTQSGTGAVSEIKPNLKMSGNGNGNHKK